MLPRPPEQAHLLARLRFEFARRRWLRRCLLALVVAVPALRFASAATALDHTRSLWGRSVEVWVADHDVSSGDLIAAHRVHLPAAAVPASALHQLPARPVAVRHVSAGATLTHDDTERRSAHTRSASLGRNDDWVVFTVTGDSTPRLHLGDPVAVYAAGSHLCDGEAASDSSASSGIPSVEIAVPPTCAAATGAQLASHAVQVGRITTVE